MTDDTMRDAIGGANKLGGGVRGDGDAVGIHDRRVDSGRGGAEIFRRGDGLDFQQLYVVLHLDAERVDFRGDFRAVSEKVRKH